MKYLLLGGSGFIGGYLARALSKNHEVIIAGRDETEEWNGFPYRQIDFVHCDDFSDFIRDVDVVVHLVSTITPSDDLSRINNELKDNVIPSNILLKNIAELKKKIVFISSGGTVYGDSEKANNERDQANPICNYGISKLMIEKYIQLFHHFYNIDYRIIRLANPYSAEAFRKKRQGVIPIIIDNILNGKVNYIWGKGQVRDYIYIDDAIDGIMAILEYQGKERIFNLGSGIGYSMEELIKLAEEKTRKRALIEFLPARKCDVKRNVLDISLVSKETGWKPTIQLSDGISKIIKSKEAEKKNGR